MISLELCVSEHEVFSLQFSVLGHMSFNQFVGISFFFYAHNLQSRYQEGIEAERLMYVSYS